MPFARLECYLIDVMAGAPGIGVEKGAFIADPWGNIFELLQFVQDSEPGAIG
jgi:hypothetical protein